VVNLALHWANAVLAYLLALALVGVFWPAFWTGVLFAVHPVATEAVTNVVGRADLMATLAVLAGLLLYARARQCRGVRALPWLAGLGVAALAGVLSKESAVALLGLMVAWDLLVARGEGMRVAGYVALLPAALGLWYLRARFAENLGPRMQLFGDNPLFGAEFWAARATAIKVIGREIGLLLWPRWLSCDYSYDEIPLVAWGAGAWENGQAVLALAVVAALVVLAVREARRRPGISFLVAFFFVTLLPSANLLVLIGSIMAERFLYLPSVAFAAGVVLAVFAAARRLVPHRAAGAAGVLLGLLAVGYGVRAVARNLDWQDGVRLWSSAVQAAPRSFKTHHGLGLALYARDAPAHANVDASIRAGEAALAIVDARPLPPVAQPSVVPQQLGIYYWTKAEALTRRGGDAAERAELYGKAVALLARAAELERVENEHYRARQLAWGRRPEDIREIGSWSTHHHLGLAYLRRGRPAVAREVFLAERRLRPDGADAYLNIAQTYVAEEDWEPAAIALLQAFAIGGPHAALPSLLAVYARLPGGECAAAPGPGLNLQCPLVHAHACQAYAELARIFLAAKLEPSARHVRDQALRHLGCPGEAFGTNARAARG
jgi:tetratricopeptide (TPR) repeat protein